MCCYESYLSKSFIPLWFYQSSDILRRSWNFPNRVHIWHSPALHFLQKDIKTNPEPDISLQVFHIQSVNFLRQQWLQHCKWPHSHVLTADKTQAVKEKTAGIWLLLPFVARFLLNSVLVSYFELYKYDRADIHYVSPLLVIPVVKTLRNFCTGWWVTAGPPKCLSVLCLWSGLSQDHQASPSTPSTANA